MTPKPKAQSAPKSAPKSAATLPDAPMPSTGYVAPVASMPFSLQVLALFAPGGEIDKNFDHYLPRSGQQAMAQAVADAIETGQMLVVEAGTGVGKTFAYLAPVLLSGQRALVSTATKTLQDQLFKRDLPELARVLGTPVHMALLKGRSSYLCLHRMDMAAAELQRMGERAALADLVQVRSWAQTTTNGDLAELPFLAEQSPLLPHITSSRENCLGSECPQYRNCYVNLARKEALVADIVVVNHHLFFADMMVREAGVAELLPTVETYIFDEAHQLNETGIQFLGDNLSTSQALDLARDILAAGLQQARGLQDWQMWASMLERATRDMRLAAGRHQMANRGGEGSVRLRWVEDAPEGVHAEDWRAALAAWGQACSNLIPPLTECTELGPDFKRLLQRVEELQALCTTFQQARPKAFVRWLDVGQQLRLIQSPLDIGKTMQAKLFGKLAKMDNTSMDNTSAALDEENGSLSSPENETDLEDTEFAHAPETPRKAWVFTSATLGDDDNLSWFTKPCGLTSAQCLRVESPFDYEKQTALYLPRPFLRPNEPEHSTEVAKIAEQAAKALGGRVLVLTTTLRSLSEISTHLKTSLAGTGIEVLVQGEGAKQALIARFQEQTGQPNKAGTVLLGSASFWEGVDVPGDALQVLIIDKLPFPPPKDPLVEARSQKIEGEGGNPFVDYHLAEAAVMLKQGTGRLIRRESDTGILVVCDPRLYSMGYGRKLLSSLPRMRIFQQESDFAQALHSLQKQNQ